MNGAVAASLIASCTAVLVALATLATTLYKRGAAEGRQTEILARLTRITGDHEDRLRTLEKTPGALRPRGGRRRPGAGRRG